MKKIIAIGIVCLFLFTGLTTVSATKTTGSSNVLKSESNTGYISVSTVLNIPPDEKGDDTPLPFVKVVLKDHNGNIMSEARPFIGFIRFTNLGLNQKYTVTAGGGRYSIQTQEVVLTDEHPNAGIIFWLDIKFTRSVNYPSALFLNLLERFPVLERLLNL